MLFKKNNLVHSFFPHIFPWILTPRWATLRSYLFLHYLPFLWVQKLPLWNDCLGLFEPENPFWVGISLSLLQFTGIYPATSFQVYNIRKDFPGRQNSIKGGWGPIVILSWERPGGRQQSNFFLCMLLSYLLIIKWSLTSVFYFYGTKHYEQQHYSIFLTIEEKNVLICF